MSGPNTMAATDRWVSDPASDEEEFGIHPGDLRIPDKFVVGDAAPDFCLPQLDGRGDVQLSALRGQPVMLVFGSYT